MQHITPEILDPRLRTVYDTVRPGVSVADIGTDHGYLICALVASGKCPGGLACDINDQPLALARRQIGEQGLSHLIEARLSDGLKKIASHEAEDIVIAGMGGELIAEILAAADWTRDPAKHYVLQPMTKAERLRRELYRMGFAIAAESAVRSGRFLYSVLSVTYTGRQQEIEDLFAWTGKMWDNIASGTDDSSNMRHKREDARQYLLRQAQALEKQAAGWEQSSSGGGGERAGERRAMAAAIRERMKDQ